MFNEKEISQLMGKKYQHQTLFTDWQKISALPVSDYSKISLFDIRHYLANNLLHKVDIATMSQGLEARVPFLDHEMVEFAINMPEKFKVREGEQKYLLKKWLEPRLPQELIYRKKWGFPAPINHWLKKELRPLTEKYLGREALENTGLFDPGMVKEMIRRFDTGEDHHYKRLWALISFQMWHETYLS